MNEKKPAYLVKDFLKDFEKCAVIDYKDKTVWIIDNGRLVVSPSGIIIDELIKLLNDWKLEAK